MIFLCSRWLELLPVQKYAIFLDPLQRSDIIFSIHFCNVKYSAYHFSNIFHWILIKSHFNKVELYIWSVLYEGSTFWNSQPNSLKLKRSFGASHDNPVKYKSKKTTFQSCFPKNPRSFTIFACLRQLNAKFYKQPRPVSTLLKGFIRWLVHIHYNPKAITKNEYSTLV